MLGYSLAQATGRRSIHVMVFVSNLERADIRGYSDYYLIQYFNKDEQC